MRQSVCVTIGRHDETRHITRGYCRFSLLDVASWKSREMAEGNFIFLDKPRVRDMQTQETDLIHLNIFRINHEET